MVKGIATFLVLLGASAAAVPACSSSSSPAVAADGGTDAGVDAPPPPLKTATCSGTATACLSGTVAEPGFTGPVLGVLVNLFRVYPYGTVVPEDSMQLAEDGTFAFSNLDPWAHYYVQAIGVWNSQTNGNAIAKVAGPFAVPSTGAIAIVLEPVFLEIEQQKPAGGTTSVVWASAHVYSPATGAELTDATVSAGIDGQTFLMPYTTNAGGSQSYYVALPANVAGATAFTITTSEPELGPQPKTWNLVGALPTFDGAVTAPAMDATVPKGMPLTVTWQAISESSFSFVELFSQSTGGIYTQTYVSPAADAPDTTTETIPGSDLATAGPYLLNVEYANATCPVTADGCVYNDSTVPVSFTAQ
jgi:hypothetical protein